MKITMICVGKIKEAYLKEAIAEYTKRLSKYCTLAIVEVDDEKTPDRLSDAEAEVILKKEAERIRKHIKESASVIALAIQGKKMDSVQFANRLENIAIQGRSHIQFVIGGSLGLHTDILKQAELLLSFSDMTFPHQLMRVILLEQIYRSYRIVTGAPYHK